MQRVTAFGVALCLGLVAGAYLKAVRPRVVNWGARAGEKSQPMPGDAIVKDAALQTTRAVSIEAPPSHVWPWLAQMGPRPRAGAYTYDWIERLLGIDMKSANRILPEYQEIEAGQFLPLDRQGANGLAVREVEPRSYLVLQWLPAMSTWAFGLYPEPDGGTRLLSRNRLPKFGPFFWLGAAFMEPASLVMERKMLLGIKQRAEALARGDIPWPAAQSDDA